MNTISLEKYTNGITSISKEIIKFSKVIAAYEKYELDELNVILPSFIAKPGDYLERNNYKREAERLAIILYHVKFKLDLTKSNIYPFKQILNALIKLTNKKVIEEINKVFGDAETFFISRLNFYEQEYNLIRENSKYEPLLIVNYLYTQPLTIEPKSEEIASMYILYKNVWPDNFISKIFAHINNHLLKI